jgi:hypothetical protein
MKAKTTCGKTILLLLTAALLAVPTQEVFALIFGGVGNDPIRDPGWPAGAAGIFNIQGRIAYWEGPPLGGGQWHAECRGDAKALSAVLADFAKLDVKNKQVVLHDGVGRSFWLNVNKDPAKRAAAQMDWVFMVWNKKSWDQLRKLPADINPIGPADAKSGPPSQIDVYTGGNVNWDNVVVPKGLTIVDQRLVAHGFTTADGTVLEGKVIDLETKKPVAAKVQLQRVEPQPKGGYQYPIVAETLTDATGHWVLKKAPEGWHQVVVDAAGYVPRVVGYGRYDDQPVWQRYDSGLARAAVVAGRVIDDAGRPLADVEVRISDVATKDGGHYQSPLGYTYKTDKDGRFRGDMIPIGTAAVWIHKTGYVRPGLGPKITTPKEDIELKMTRSARLEVTVDFTNAERPQGYIVRLEPEGGDKIGSYGGSGNIDAKNQMTFDQVPPGRYQVSGRPNPGSDSQQIEPVTVELKGGETLKVKLSAK